MVPASPVHYFSVFQMIASYSRIIRLSEKVYNSFIIRREGAKSRNEFFKWFYRSKITALL